MLGHQLLRQLKNRHRVHTTLRRGSTARSRIAQWLGDDAIVFADAADFKTIECAIDADRPDVVINCIGIIKQLGESKDPIACIGINALLPHLLERFCARLDIRLIHFSTDCVFSGTKGNYNELDAPDARDLYGRTKLLGEVNSARSLTLRTSIIGPELGGRNSLLEWFLGQSNKSVQGYRRAIYSGLTTYEMARLVEKLIAHHDALSGTWHVSSDAISKYELLCMIRDRMELPISIAPCDQFACDRSLDSSKFRAVTGYSPPSWTSMVDEIAKRNLENQSL